MSLEIQAERFFREFISYKPKDFAGIEEERLESILDFRCSDFDQQQLVREVTEEEVRAVLFSMPSNKSPGPDGYTCEFFKSCVASVW